MRQPEFWYDSKVTPLAQLLRPIGQVYSAAGQMLFILNKPWRATVPIICVGNLMTGGTGKTPTAIAIGRYLNNKGFNIHFLSRGYGRRSSKSRRVDPSNHTSEIVGDEPLLLANTAPTWVSSNRREIAELAIKAGANILVMDDGFQNPSIHKDLSILVIDGEIGFGNNLVIPAGPLREKIVRGVSRANAALILGKDLHELGKVFEQTFTNNIKILRGHLEPDATATDLVEKRVFAFAGIGRPKKFFDTLKNIGCVITGTLEFDDHHTYTVDEIKNLVQKADEMNATLITTSKDCCRIDRNLAPGIIELPISLHWENQSILDKMLEPILSTIE